MPVPLICGRPRESGDLYSVTSGPTSAYGSRRFGGDELELGALLVDLLDQQLPLHRDQRPTRLLRRVERRRGVRIVAQHVAAIVQGGVARA